MPEGVDAEPTRYCLVHGRVAVGELEQESGTGAVDLRRVTSTLRRRMRSTRRCYERQLRSEMSLAGRVLVRFTIARSGGTSDVATVENTTESEALASCVVETVDGIRFHPAPERGSVTYTVPVTFRPGP